MHLQTKLKKVGAFIMPAREGLHETIHCKMAK